MNPIVIIAAAIGAWWLYENHYLDGIKAAVGSATAGNDGKISGINPAAITPPVYQTPQTAAGPRFLGPPIVQTPEQATAGPVLMTPAGPQYITPPPIAGNRTLRIGTTNGIRGSRVTLPITLDSPDDVVAFSFSIEFDRTRLANPTITLAPSRPADAVLTLNPNQVASGLEGLLVDSSMPLETSVGPVEVLQISFDILASAPTGVGAINFVAHPAPESASDRYGNLLPMNYTAGAVIVG